LLPGVCSAYRHEAVAVAYFEPGVRIDASCQ
jgi:hypothetical protein